MSILAGLNKWLLYLVVFLTPFTFILLTLDKQFFLSAVIFLIFIFWLVKAAVKGEFVYTKSPASILVLLLIAFTAVSAWFSGSRYASFMGVDGSEADVFMNVLAFGLLFLLIVLTLRKAKETVFLFYILLASSAVILIASFVQFLYFGQTASNIVGTSNALAVYLGFAFVALVSFLYHGLDFSVRTKILLGISALIFLTALILINFWAVFAGLILSMGILVCTGLKNKKIIPIIVAVISVFMLLVDFNVIKLNLTVIDFPVEISPSLKASWNVARGALRADSKNFLLGSGPNTFSHQYQLHREVSLNSTPYWNLKFFQGINAIVTHLSNWGIVGTFLFLAFAGFSLWSAFQLANWPIFMGLFYLTVMLFFYPQNFVIYFTIFALSGLSVAAFSGVEKKYKMPAAISSAFIVLLVAAFLFGIYVNGKRYIGSVYFAKGVDMMRSAGDLEKALPLLLSGDSWYPNNDSHLRALSAAFLLKTKSDDDQSQFALDAGGAIRYALRATKVNPIESLNWLELAQVYDNLASYNVGGAAEEAVAAYKKAGELDPKNPQISVSLGRSYVMAKEYESAVVALTKSLELKPDYAPAHFTLVQVFDLQGKTEEAIARAEKLKAFGDVGILFQLGLLHYQANRFNEAKDALEAAVKLFPDYSNALYFLGLIYDKEGLPKLALAKFRKISKLNPENQEVKKIVKNLSKGKRALDGILADDRVQDRKTAPIEEETKKK